MAQLAAAGVPAEAPWVISEYGFSPFAGRAMSETASALLAADIVGDFLTHGGASAYMFGFTPDQPANQKFPCAGYGNMMLWETDDTGRSRWPMPSFYALRLMTEDWGAPADEPHTLYAAHAALADAQGRPYVTAYPLKSPNGRWSVMLVNRDEARAHAAPIVLAAGGARQTLAGPLRVAQYSAAEYAWADRGEASRPTRDLPPARYTLPAGRTLVLPALSLTVVTWDGPGASLTALR
jgi:hypothetical protein